MRDATFTSPVIDIDLACLFGGLTVIVPEGVRVENQVISIFGESDVGHLVQGTHRQLRGMCLFGGVSVKAKPRRTPPRSPSVGRPSAGHRRRARLARTSRDDRIDARLALTAPTTRRGGLFRRGTWS